MFSKKHRVLAVLIMILVLGIGGLGYSLIRTDAIKTKAETFYPKNAILSLSPFSGNYSIGQTFDVQIRANSLGQPLYGVHIRYLNYDPAVLEAQSLTWGSFNLNPHTPRNYTISNGKIWLQQYYNIDNTSIAWNEFTIATVKFKALKAMDNTKMTFDFVNGAQTDCNVLKDVGPNLACPDILGTVKNGTYSVKSNLGPNIVANPSFEINTGWPGRADYWNAAMNYWRVNERAKDGGYSYKFTSPGYGVAADNNMVNPKANTSYTLSGWVNILSGYNGNSYLDISDRPWECQAVANRSIVNSWQKVSCNFKTGPETYAPVRIVNDGTSGTVYWDLVEVRAQQ